MWNINMFHSLKDILLTNGTIQSCKKFSPFIYPFFKLVSQELYYVLAEQRASLDNYSIVFFQNNYNLLSLQNFANLCFMYDVEK